MSRYHAYLTGGDNLRKKIDIKATDDAMAMIEAKQMLAEAKCHALEIGHGARLVGRLSLAKPAALASRSPLIPDIDIWRCANELIKQYGDTADIEAAARADEYEAKGDRDGQDVWLRILRAIDDLQTIQPGDIKH